MTKLDLEDAILALIHRLKELNTYTVETLRTDRSPRQLLSTKKVSLRAIPPEHLFLRRDHYSSREQSTTINSIAISIDMGDFRKY